MIERNNKIYTNIEYYKDYELIECITFEMAIRNSQVQKLFWEAYKTYNKLYPSLSNDDLNNTNSELNYEEEILLNKINDIFKTIENEYYIDSKDFQVASEEYIFEELLNNNIDGNENPDVLYGNLLFYVNRYLNSLLENRNEIIPKRTIELIKEQSELLSKKSLFGDMMLEYSKIEEEDRTKIFNDRTEFKNIIVDTTINPTKKSSKKELTLIPSTIKMKVPDFYNNNVFIELNLNLPTKDLKDKLEYIKKMYDKHNKLVLQDNDILNLNFQDKNKIKSIKRDSLYLANQFYMYDFYLIEKLKNNQTDEEIFVSLELDYFDNMTTRGIQNSINKMKKYIQNSDYKLLLTQN